ncbi:hypothetical protein Anas_12828 [Armadillidium nasatum]|uniref:Uncharacterized protein n=1 Tax=Armadillidium nasatum TaxID=96803 RepID=A0A5N5STE9_9CRUS|nr:hypothetical protein Anas_12828 [Armadillidium nasatum]
MCNQFEFYKSNNTLILETALVWATNDKSLTIMMPNVESLLSKNVKTFLTVKIESVHKAEKNISKFEDKKECQSKNGLIFCFKDGGIKSKSSFWEDVIENIGEEILYKKELQNPSDQDVLPFIDDKLLISNLNLSVTLIRQGRLKKSSKLGRVIIGEKVFGEWRETASNSPSTEWFPMYRL